MRAPGAAFDGAPGMVPKGRAAVAGADVSGFKLGKAGCKVFGAALTTGFAGSMLSRSRTVASREGSLGNGIRSHLQVV